MPSFFLVTFRFLGSMLMFVTGSTLITLNLTFVPVLRHGDSHFSLTTSRLGRFSKCGRRGGSTLISIPANLPVGGATFPARSTTAWVRLNGVRLRGSCWIHNHGTSTFLVCPVQLANLNPNRVVPLKVCEAKQP